MAVLGSPSLTVRTVSVDVKSNTELEPLNERRYLWIFIGYSKFNTHALPRFKVSLFGVCSLCPCTSPENAQDVCHSSPDMMVNGSCHVLNYPGLTLLRQVSAPFHWKTHAKRSHTHVKDHVVHVRVRWITETPK